MIDTDFLQPKYDMNFSYTISLQDDYSKMLADMGVTEEYLRELSENEFDRIDIDLDKVMVTDSQIEGKGIVATSAIKSGAIVGVANTDRKRTQIGRYTNHSGTPNAVAVVKLDELVFVAIDNIDDGDEITADYRNVRAESLRLQSRLSIQALHKSIEETKGHLTEDDFPLKHYFSEGVYVREFFMEKGATVIGKIHRHNHIAMLIKGRARVVSEEGSIEMSAPHIWNSKAGEKRAVYSLEDCIFVTIHPTDETDLAKIEEQVIAPDYEALENLI